MTKKEWETLLGRLEINTRTGKLKPVQPQKLDGFESLFQVKLPLSYRGYCEAFGTGELGMQFQIAVPGYEGSARHYSLEFLQDLAHAGIEYELYSKDPEQHRRGIFFGLDIGGWYFFFDPADITDRERHEYAVYHLSPALDRLERTGTNFAEFITEYCLGAKHDQLISDLPAEQLFLPVG